MLPVVTGWYPVSLGAPCYPIRVAAFKFSGMLPVTGCYRMLPATLLAVWGPVTRQTPLGMGRAC